MTTKTTLPRVMIAGAAAMAAQAMLCGVEPWSVDWPLLMVTFGATVIVPPGLEVVRRHDGAVPDIHPALLAAAWLGMVVSAKLQQGWLAALTGLPWMLVTLFIAGGTLVSLCRRPHRLARVVMLSGPVMLAVGGAWYLADRAGWEAFGFDFLVVRLTAAHFHFAGFALPVVAGLVWQHWQPAPVWLRAASLGVLAGVPAVATGITLTRIGVAVEWECSIAVVFSVCAGGIGFAQVIVSARSHQHATVRLLLGISGLCLIAGMSLALLYALRPWRPLPWLHLPRMWAWHGSIHAFGFALPGMMAWVLWRRSELH